MTVAYAAEKEKMPNLSHEIGVSVWQGAVTLENSLLVPYKILHAACDLAVGLPAIKLKK